jgi:hypothetical protein
MNDTTIQMIAQAIIANTKVIQSLIEALPHDAKTAVAEVVTVSAPAFVAPTPTPVVQAAPVVVAAPVVAAPVVAAAPAMPAPPSFVAPAPVVQVPVQGGAPFSDGKGLIDYVMGAYKALGAAKGAGIQNVLVGLGYQNINDVKPEHYGALFAGIEALK